MRKAGLKMVLDTPEVVEAHLLRERHLLQYLMKNLGLALVMF
jgi:hypothetical protein